MTKQKTIDRIEYEQAFMESYLDAMSKVLQTIKQEVNHA